MSISKQVEKQTVVYPYNALSYDNKNEQMICATAWMNLESIILSEKKLVMRDSLLYSTSHFIILHLYESPQWLNIQSKSGSVVA